MDEARPRPMLQMNVRERPPHLTVVRNHSHEAETVLADALEQLANALPECVAAGFLELRTGATLEMKTVAALPRVLLDRVGDPLRQRAASGLESMFLKTRSNDYDDRYFQEVLVLSSSLIHVFQRCKKRDGVVLMTVCLGSANMGMVLTQLRLQLPAIESIILG